MTAGLDHSGRDDELRALLGAADPVASFSAADPVGVARLLEDAMTDRPQLTEETRADGAHRRSRLTWTVAAAALVLISGGVFLAVALDDDGSPAPIAADGPAPAEQDPAPELEPNRTVTELVVDEGTTSARCLTPQSAPQVVAAQTTVVDATVDSISGSAVTLTPTRFYAGEESGVVVVQAPGPDMQALLAAVTFEEGGRYLVAATDGRVTLCGFSAKWSEDLAGVYAEAFGG